jgi:hypothetical protein
MDKFSGATNFASKFELFFNELQIAFNRCEYTKVIDDIEEKKSYFTNKSNIWMTQDLLLSCYNMIVRKYLIKIRTHSQNSFYYIKKWLNEMWNFGMEIGNLRREQAQSSNKHKHFDYDS